ncbi:hypothetical protein QFZ23_001929 [Arthrobacter globiformis]|nr:hypothetical protein [Arthrobacter globiformis]
MHFSLLPRWVFTWVLLLGLWWLFCLFMVRLGECGMTWDQLVEDLGRETQVPAVGYSLVLCQHCPALVPMVLTAFRIRTRESFCLLLFMAIVGLDCMTLLFFTVLS